MARPTKYHPQRFVDAATTLYAEGGLGSVTMSAVAERLGAPNGSIYHRFGTRGELLAAVWLHAVRTMHAATNADFDPERDPIAAAAAAAEAMCRWCVEHPELATVLAAGQATFQPDTWPDTARETAVSENREFRRTSSALIKQLRARGIPAEAVTLALIDLPYTAVRRYLADHERIPGTLPGIVGQAVRSILQHHAQSSPGDLPDQERSLTDSRD
jgi:AcrR family transcriptional regulator